MEIPQKLIPTLRNMQQQLISSTFYGLVNSLLTRLVICINKCSKYSVTFQLYMENSTAKMYCIFTNVINYLRHCMYPQIHKREKYF